MIFDAFSDLLGRVRGMLAGLLKSAAGVFLALVAAEVALCGLLMAAAKLRSRLREGPREPFPREEQPEIELESSEERMKLYLDYESAYEAMFEEIERAERTIFIGTFTWEDNEVGHRFVNALAQKAREGVKVYAVFDAVANIGRSASFKRFPEEIHTMEFRPFSTPASFLNPYNYIRNHRKLLTVDGRVAFTGGCNIGGLYLTGWRDTHVRVRGDLAREMENAFADFWNRNRAEDLPEIPLDGEGERDWNPATVVRVNDPTMGLFPIRAMFLGPMNRAKKRIYLTSVYFMPSRAIEDELMSAAKRGVDVQVLVPKQSNYPLADWLARRRFGELLEAGVRIFAYDEHYVIHAKTVTIDGAWSTVGSANIDSLSLFGLHEINLEVYSERFAERMESIFELDKTACEEVTLEEWENRPALHKLIEKALAPLRPFA